MKGDSKCHIFSEQGRDNFDSIFRKNKVVDKALKAKATRPKRAMSNVDSSIPPYIKRETNDTE